MNRMTRKFRAKGMHCQSCKELIERSVKKIDGVVDVKVSYETGAGEVVFDRDKANIGQILNAIEEKGYECSITGEEKAAEKTETKEEAKAEAIGEAEKAAEKIVISKLTVWKAVSGILALLLIFSIWTGGFWRGGANDAAAKLAQAAQVQQQPSVPTSMAQLADDDAVKGDPNAPVTIVEWSDYQCPFCQRFYSQTLDKIDDEYIKTGKVKMIYRDFPLSFHENAQKAAEAAECAGEQGKYWDMHNLLFEGGVEGGITDFKQYASGLGLDTNSFNSCLDSGKMASEVKKDMQDGIAAGVKGTPAFVINGKLVSGALPFESFKQVIDAELAQA